MSGWGDDATTRAATATAGRLPLGDGTSARPGDQRAHGAIAGAALDVEQPRDATAMDRPGRRRRVVAGRRRPWLTIEPSHVPSLAWRTA
jgi:hypothetical protein